MQCTNNLKQYVISIHNYHDVNGVTPASRMNFYNANINFGWGERLNGWVNATVAMLPFMEQTARYDAYSEQAKNAPYGSWPWEIASDDVMTTPIPTLLRLSDGNASQPCSYKNYARTSIALSVGDGLWHNNTATCYTGVDIEKVGNRGFFAPLAWRPFSFVNDGLSQTVAISELTSDEAYSTKVKGESSRRRLSRARSREARSVLARSDRPERPDAHRRRNRDLPRTSLDGRTRPERQFHDDRSPELPQLLVVLLARRSVMGRFIRAELSFRGRERRDGGRFGAIRQRYDRLRESRRRGRAERKVSVRRMGRDGVSARRRNGLDLTRET